MSKDFNLGDYKTVAERLVEFFAKHPEGALQPLDTGEPFTIRELDGRLYVVYVAAAYRTADDPRPGIGVAWEPFPGRTPYTKESELMNAETSAWGRAILAVGASDTKQGIASQDEVRNRRDAEPQCITPKTCVAFRESAKARGLDLAALVVQVTNDRTEVLAEVREGNERAALKDLIASHPVVPVADPLPLETPDPSYAAGEEPF